MRRGPEPSPFISCTPHSCSLMQNPRRARRVAIVERDQLGLLLLQQHRHPHDVRIPRRPRHRSRVQVADEHQHRLARLVRLPEALGHGFFSRRLLCLHGFVVERHDANRRAGLTQTPNRLQQIEARDAGATVLPGVAPERRRDEGRAIRRLPRRAQVRVERWLLLPRNLQRQRQRRRIAQLAGQVGGEGGRGIDAVNFAENDDRRTGQRLDAGDEWNRAA